MKIEIIPALLHYGEFIFIGGNEECCFSSLPSCYKQKSHEIIEDCVKNEKTYDKIEVARFNKDLVIVLSKQYINNSLVIFGHLTPLLNIRSSNGLMRYVSRSNEMFIYLKKHLFDEGYYDVAELVNA